MNRKLTSVVLILIAVFVAVGVVRERRADRYRLAAKLPAGALIYVQVADLPSLIGRWRDSELRRRWLASGNFEKFQTRHLALKLADRADEIESALGLAPDLDLAAALAGKDAALAVYDIGRLGFVFIAPAGKAREIAAPLMARAESFDRLTVRGADVYAREFDVNRGREKQKVLFAFAGGCFVLATDEARFMRTLDNLRGRGGASIADDATFRELSATLEPHLATVWTDQRKLNDDWYFRHYFGHPDDARVKTVRAAMFDLAETDGGLTESRVFIGEPDAKPPRDVDAATVARLAKFVPASAALTSFAAAGADSAAAAIVDAAFGPALPDSDADRDATGFGVSDWNGELWNARSGDGDDDIACPAATADEARRDPPVDALTPVLTRAEPLATAAVFGPAALPEPFVVDDRKAVAIALRRPERFDRESFERAVGAVAGYRTTAGATEMAWSDFREDKFAGRELKLRGLGWSVAYTVRDDVLIVSGSRELLADALTSNGIDAPRRAVSRFVFFRPDAAREPFRSMLTEFDLASGNLPGDDDYFFLRTAGSLFDVAEGLRSVEMTERSAGGLTFETISYDY